jgi:hypothetical protein
MNITSVPAQDASASNFDTTLDARAHTEALAYELATIGARLLESYEQNHWRTLGYDNFLPYAEKELALSRPVAAELLNAALLRDALQIIEEVAP